MKFWYKMLNFINFLMLPEFPSPEHVLTPKAELCFCRRWNYVAMMSFSFALHFAPCLCAS